ncbi:hypothetical protein DFP95_11175 [Cohnella lupini]|uniref:Uncharacterized protein n=1 Tax=Cohnella lupini TaxID=1294267 RepID=A0A3D9I649_9BACL|nr:hypothetical protein DFP95_11175 [Cohnella lupini]
MQKGILPWAYRIEPVPEEDALLICPICNALSPLEISCPDCGSAAEDEGRWSDWSGPYAPYEPAQLSAQGTLEIAIEVICQHAVRCIDCHRPFTADITAWHV